MSGDFRIKIPKNASPEEIKKYMKEFNKQWQSNKQRLHCKITKNPCGTDTWAVPGPGCLCDNCQLWIKETNWDTNGPSSTQVWGKF